MTLPTTTLFKFSLILIIVTIITYINILPNGLFFDDEELIYKNTYVAHMKFLPKYFTTNMVAGAGKVSNMYRPILTTSFAIDHQIWGNYPLGYHLTSIILHAANSILVMILVQLLFGNSWISFLTALFFSVHPAYSEAVIYASGRTDPLFVFWGLSSIITFLVSVKNKKRNIFLYISSLVLSLLSLLSKETAIIFPLLILLCMSVYDRKKSAFNPVSYVLLVPFFLISLFYFLLRLTVLNFSNTLNFYSGLILSPDMTLYSSNIFVRLFTFTKVCFSYIFLLLFPGELSVSRTPQIVTSVFNIWVILFLCSALGLLAVSLKIYKINKLPIFTFIWFFISILPVSGIIPINNIFAEHYLYLPSISVFAFVSFLIVKIIDKFNNPVLNKIFISLLALIIIILSLRTITRSFDWRNAIVFYTVSLKQSPGNIPMRHNLAMAYQDAGRTDEAIKEYKNIISQTDIYPNTHHNLANAYVSIGKYQEAETEYYKALKMDPNFNFSYYGLAQLYQKTGEKEKLDKIVAIINSLNK